MSSDIIIDMHGFNNVVSSVNRDNSHGSRMVRWFWVCVIVVMMCVATYFIICVYSTTNKIAMRRSVQHMESVRIPDVAFCIQHVWQEEPGGYDVLKSLFADDEYSERPYRNITEGTSNDDPAVEDDVEQFYRNNLIKCDAVMVRCLFENEAFNCCDSNMTFRHINQRDYLCFVIESVGDQNLLDPLRGLTVLLKVKGLQKKSSDFYHFMTKNGGDSIVSLDSFHGARIILADQFRQYQSNTILAAPGSWTHVSFEEIDIKRMVDCFQAPPYGTSHGCYEACFSHITVQECDCIHISHLERPAYQQELLREEFGKIGKNMTGPKLCNPFKLNTCLKTNSKNYTDMVSECYKYHCGKSCHEIIYRTSATYASLDLSWAAGALKNSQGHYSVSGSTEPGDLAYVSVASRQLGKTIETEFSILGPVSYISMVGGQLGLWLGASVITILQCIVAAGITLTKKFWTKRLHIDSRSTKLKNNQDIVAQDSMKTAF